MLEGETQRQRFTQSLRQRVATAAEFIMKAPIYGYRWSVRPWLGWPCRHLPTCSDYALEAIDKNGPWRGFWLTVSRLARCRPGGSAGFDPVPDTRHDQFPWQPWRHGRWGRGHMAEQWPHHKPAPRPSGKDEECLPKTGHCRGNHDAP